MILAFSETSSGSSPPTIPTLPPSNARQFQMIRGSKRILKNSSRPMTLTLLHARDSSNPQTIHDFKRILKNSLQLMTPDLWFGPDKAEEIMIVMVLRVKLMVSQRSSNLTKIILLINKLPNKFHKKHMGKGTIPKISVCFRTRIFRKT